MTKVKSILQNLKNKSNIDYEYFHLFNNQKLDLKYDTNNFTINYIIYIINSDFSRFYDFYKTIQKESITDVFFERLYFSQEDKKDFFSMKFKELFWLKLNNIDFTQDDYSGLVHFLSLNSLDINRIFLENTHLEKEFFILLQQIRWCNNLTFLNFDNNNIENQWLSWIIYFLKNNNIDLEYLSLINTNISEIDLLLEYLILWNIRILDISSNTSINSQSIIKFIELSSSIRELYLRNIEFSDQDLENIINIFTQDNSTIYNLRLSLRGDQLKYKEIFKRLEQEKNINFDINIIAESQNNIYSTVYIKEIENPDEKLNNISNDYFYLINWNNRDKEFDEIVQTKDKYLTDAINLFLFDFNDYKKIDYLLVNYDFNYLYMENYYITDEDFVSLIHSIKNQKHKKYKINLISVELSEAQLNYLINNFPENIYYIEINLNKIDKKRELYISKMLKNKAFIFENMELYQKIFK